MRKQTFTVLGAVLLTSCGGDGDSSAISTVPAVPNSTPTAVPTPTSTPTPMPTGTTLLNFSGSKLFDTMESLLQYNREATGLVSLPISALGFSPSNDNAFIYDAPSSTRYYFFNGSNVPPNNSFYTYFSAPFNNLNKVGADSAFTRYRTMDQGVAYNLSILNPGSANTRLPLYYVGIGTAEASGPSSIGTSVSTDFRAFGYGFAADVSAVPKTGTGQYSGFVIGRAIEISGTNVYTVSGTLDITMDFASSTYVGTVALLGTAERTGQTITFGSFPLTTATSYGAPLNNITAYIGPRTSSFRAKLAGNTAEELEGSFTLVIPDPRGSGLTLNIVGAVAARR